MNTEHFTLEAWRAEQERLSTQRDFCGLWQWLVIAICGPAMHTVDTVRLAKKEIPYLKSYKLIASKMERPMITF